jgi:hypothetical protein
MSDQSVDALSELVAKGERAHFQRDLDIDWLAPARLPLWMTHRMAVWAVSQFQHGEMATAEMCASVSADLSCAQSRIFIETQYRDELRHARLFKAYLLKLGASTPVSAPQLEACFDRARDWRGAPDAVLLAFHVILEGENLRIQNSIDSWMTCPLLKEIGRVVARDEARHIAFGKHYLRGSLPTLSLAERLEMYRWLKELWHQGAAVVIARLMPPLLVGRRSVRDYMSAAWRERERDLENVCLFSRAERRLFRAQ